MEFLFFVSYGKFFLFVGLRKLNYYRGILPGNISPYKRIIIMKFFLFFYLRMFFSFIGIRKFFSLVSIKKSELFHTTIIREFFLRVSIRKSDIF